MSHQLHRIINEEDLAIACDKQVTDLRRVIRNINLQWPRTSLDMFGEITREERDIFHKAGIESAQQLWHSVNIAKETQPLARKTKLSENRIKACAAIVEKERLSGNVMRGRKKVRRKRSH